MKRFSLLSAALLLASCQSNTALDQVVSQKYVHKYGFPVSESEWEERAQDGQVVATLKNGVKVTKSYENGNLHGPTTYTFPHSNVVEKMVVYDQGALLKESVFDPAGMPIREEVYEFDNRTLITLWDEKGVPLSIEEYEGEKLMDGKYFDPSHTLEAEVTDGTGERVKRDRAGTLLLRDKIDLGLIASRTTYHPSGQIHTVSNYSEYQLHGEQSKYTATGKPLMQLNWNQGTLSGTKVVFRNGKKIAEVPYINGKKEGIEYHYDDLGYCTAEITWKSDKKHGPSKFHTDETTETEWYYAGKTISPEKFDMMDTRDKLVADLSHDVE